MVKLISWKSETDSVDFSLNVHNDMTDVRYFGFELKDRKFRTFIPTPFLFFCKNLVLTFYATEVTQ